MVRPHSAKQELVCSAEHASTSTCSNAHLPGLGKRLSRWRRVRLVRRALRQAGEPSLVLDLSHESGSFWPVLAEHGNRVILAATTSMEHLSMLLDAQPAALAARVKLVCGDAAAIQLPDNAVDCILCMDLLSRRVAAEQRLAILRELRRVTRDTLIVSLELDGNYQAWRQGAGGLKRTAVEEEIGRIGFDIVGRHGFWPGYSTLWVYVLRKED